VNSLVINQDTTELERVLNILVEKTVEDPYEPLKELQWPDSLPKGYYWMSPELMSIHGTDYEHTLTEAQKIELSRWEFVNFCSLNVTGIRELLVEMTGRLHTPGFELLSEYLHYLIAEENEHMWYFSKFCLQYANKIYPDRALAMSGFEEEDIANLMIFSRILIFEEIVDFYNRKMGKDKALPDFVRKINWLHHLDEGRHIKYGRLYIEIFYQQLREKYSDQKLREIEQAIKGFMQISVQKLYRREMYVDAGLDEPGKMRKALLKHPEREAFNRSLLAGTVKFFVKIGLFSSADIWETSPSALA
jgi:hypothetical protein